MPRTNINSDLMSGAVGDGLDRSDPVARVELSWEPKSHVQVAIGTLETGTDLPGRYQTGTYVSLNRDGINRFITDLRRARDAAYGRDA